MVKTQLLQHRQPTWVTLEKKVGEIYGITYKLLDIETLQHH